MTFSAVLLLTLAACAPAKAPPVVRADPPPVARAAVTPSPCPSPPPLQADENGIPAWAAGQTLSRCQPPGQCIGSDFTCLCVDDGRLVSSEYGHPGIRRHFDAQGREVATWHTDRDDGRRLHSTFAYADVGDCVVESRDHDGDGFVDEVCRWNGLQHAHYHCAVPEPPLASEPCPAATACPEGARCGCDAQGRVVEQVASPSFGRRTLSYDAGGRVAEVADFARDGRLLRKVNTVFDAQGRAADVTTTFENGQTARVLTEWTADGSRTERTFHGTQLYSVLEWDLSVPGQRTVKETVDGKWVSTVLVREEGDRKVVVTLVPPMTEPWVSCAATSDCELVVDRCDSYRGYYVNRRFAVRMKRALRSRCHGITGGPLVVPMPSSPPMCALRLCAANDGIR